MSTTLNVTAQYWAFIFFIIATFGLCTFMLVFSWLLGGRSVTQSNKNVPFESGVASVGDTHFRFSAKFYLVAMFFVIFDVEALFLYAWSASIRENGWVGFIEALIFILVLMLSLIYLVRTGAMNWSPLPHHVVIKSNLVSYDYSNHSFTKTNIFKTRQ